MRKIEIGGQKGDKIKREIPQLLIFQEVTGFISAQNRSTKIELFWIGTNRVNGEQNSIIYCFSIRINRNESVQIMERFEPDSSEFTIRWHGVDTGFLVKSEKFTTFVLH